eukprot:TRINITY_DN7027_c0_g1_i5.p1 TRINITY_DN7027_c0_g1~~TRINITY_DN7027_c0_g1_i5.p1  ORF type:complete len:105 (-),score=6.63 TRINITY_DN7027_c0_g1_i5:182-496(-)
MEATICESHAARTHTACHKKKRIRSRQQASGHHRSGEQGVGALPTTVATVRKSGAAASTKRGASAVRLYFVPLRCETGTRAAAPAAEGAHMATAAAGFSWNSSA